MVRGGFPCQSAVSSFPVTPPLQCATQTRVSVSPKGKQPRELVYVATGGDQLFSSEIGKNNQRAHTDRSWHFAGLSSALPPARRQGGRCACARNWVARSPSREGPRSDITCCCPASNKFFRQTSSPRRGSRERDRPGSGGSCYLRPLGSAGAGRLGSHGSSLQLLAQHLPATAAAPSAAAGKREAPRGHPPLHSAPPLPLPLLLAPRVVSCHTPPAPGSSLAAGLPAPASLPRALHGSAVCLSAVGGSRGSARGSGVPQQQQQLAVSVKGKGGESSAPRRAAPARSPCAPRRRRGGRARRGTRLGTARCGRRGAERARWPQPG